MGIGRSNVNDLVLDHAEVSRFHAEIVSVGGVIEIRDLDSEGGTRVDGRRVTRSVIRDGARLGVGPFELYFDGSRLRGSNGRGALRLAASEVSVTADGRPLLDRVSMVAEPGELICVIGESGAGKSTMLRLLAGVTSPSTGSVTLDGEPVASRLTDVGYVPQDEIVHPRLTVREALEFAAKLRLPREVERSEIDATIDRVLVEVALDEHESKRIAQLSGGQRKRAGVASELLNRPSLLCLDEPTTGLDPGLEAQMMHLFRELAHPGERAVVVVTHATGSLDLCDKLAVFGRGGKLAFYGPPREAKEFFEVDDYDSIYDQLLTRDSEQWRRKFEADREPVSAPPDEGEEVAAPKRRKQGLGHQSFLLTWRYSKLFSRDVRNLAVIFGQVPLIALATAFLFEPGLFNQEGGSGEGGGGDPRYAIQLIFVLATTAIWFGSISSAREIVKERAVIAREAAIGVRWGAYLLSKMLVIGSVVVLQTIFLTYFVLVIRPLDEPAGTYAAVTALLLLTGFAAVALGLLVSAISKSEEQATSFIPLTLIPQLLFAGALVPVEKMAGPIEALSNLALARWSLASLGNAIDMNGRIGSDLLLLQSDDFGTSFFSTLPGQGAAIITGFLIAFTVATLVVLERRGADDQR